MVIAVGKEKYFVGLCTVVIEPSIKMKYLSSSSSSVSYTSTTDQVTKGGLPSTSRNLLIKSQISNGNFVVLVGTCNQALSKLFSRKLVINDEESMLKYEISGDPAIYVTVEVSGTLIMLDGHTDRTFKTHTFISKTPYQPPINYVIKDQIERCDEWLKATASYAEAVRTMLPLYSRKSVKV